MYNQPLRGINMEKVRYINDLRELPHGRMMITDGNSSVLYKVSPHIYYKKFGERYIRLDKDKRQELMNFLEYILYIDAKNYVAPMMLYRNKDRLFGYTIVKVSGKNLNHVSKRTKVSEFIENLDEMKETMRILADKRVVLSDVNMSNIIYNKSFYLIDIDNSYIDYTHSKDIIYLSNMNKFYMDVVNTLISDMPEVLGRNCEFRERERLLGQGFNEDYKEMLIFMKELLENYYNKEIVTINDFRKLTRR